MMGRASHAEPARHPYRLGSYAAASCTLAWQPPVSVADLPLCGLSLDARALRTTQCRGARLVNELLQVRIEPIGGARQAHGQNTCAPAPN
jgi:hypothetical protein